MQKGSCTCMWHAGQVKYLFLSVCTTTQLSLLTGSFRIKRRAALPCTICIYIYTIICHTQQLQWNASIATGRLQAVAQRPLRRARPLFVVVVFESGRGFHNGGKSGVKQHMWRKMPLHGISHGDIWWLFNMMMMMIWWDHFQRRNISVCLKIGYTPEMLNKKYREHYDAQWIDG